MKKLVFSITLLLSISLLTYAQKYEIYENNKAGVPERTGYIKRVEELPRFNPYVGNGNVESYGRLIRERQITYDENVKRVQEVINDCSYYINELKPLNRNAYLDIHLKLDDYINALKTTRIDYSQDGEKVISDLRYYLSYIKQEIRNSEGSKSYVSQDYLKTYSGTVAVWTSSHIVEKPEIGAKIIGLADDGVVTILSQYNDRFYFVQWKNIKGYMAKSFFK